MQAGIVALLHAGLINDLSSYFASGNEIISEMHRE